MSWAWDLYSLNGLSYLDEKTFKNILKNSFKWKDWHNCHVCIYNGCFNFIWWVTDIVSDRPSAWTEKAAKLRQVITDILPIDVHRPQPLAPDALPSAGADCLVSCFCLESVSPDLAAFTRALGHIGRLLRTGGHLLLIGALGESYYFGGPGVKIPVVPLNEAQVCASLKESGFTLIRLEVYTLNQDMRVGVDDVTGVFFAKARKD